MKRFLHSPVTWILISLLGIIIFLYFCGFRITYAPTLDNNWDAVSACAAWFSGIMSAGALFVAISIPKIIAEQQNKIALFDKRYKLYDSFVFLIIIVQKIFDGSANGIDRKIYFETLIETHKSVSTAGEFTSSCKATVDAYTRLIFEIGKVEFLFDIEESNDILAFLKSFDTYVSEIYKSNSADEKPLKEAFLRLDVETIQNKLENQLKI